MKIKHFINYGTIIDKMEGTIHIGPQGSRIQAIEHTAVNQTANEKTHSFRNIVQYPDADELIARLHQLIDGSQGADVGCVLLHCKLHNYLKPNTYPAGIPLGVPTDGHVEIDTEIHERKQPECVGKSQQYNCFLK